MLERANGSESPLERQDQTPVGLDPTGLARTLVEATARAISGRDCSDLADVGRANWLEFWAADDPDRAHLAARAAQPFERACALDPEEVADWMVGQYPGSGYPAVVIGSPHGSAAHLAAAMSAPWLPAAFTMDVRWPEGVRDRLWEVLARGDQVADALSRPHRALTVRQVHDPVRFGQLTAAQTTHHLACQRLPAAYRSFLKTQLTATAQVFIVDDRREWPDLAGAGSGSAGFQLGTPQAGLSVKEYLIALDGKAPLSAAMARARLRRRWHHRVAAERGIDDAFVEDLRRSATQAGRTVHRLTYDDPSALAGVLADLYRGWLQASGRDGDQAVVECGRVLDPYQVIRARLVPYWCEAPSVAAVRAAEMWLAGSRPFTSVEVLPEGAGRQGPAIATLDQWLAAARFAPGEPTIDEELARVYPNWPLSPRHARDVLCHHPSDAPELVALTAGPVLAALGERCREAGVRLETWPAGNR
jgi:hypothetical protein